MILWLSDCPDSAGGFGVVTKNILHYLKDQYTVASICFAKFSVIKYDDYIVYPFARPIQLMINRIESDHNEKIEAIIVHGAPWVTPFKDVLIELQSIRPSIPIIGYFVHEALSLPQDIESYFKPGRLLDAIITPTKATAELANINDYYVVPHGVDPKIWHPYNRKFNKFTIAFVSKNHPRKRWDLFFRVLARLIKDGIQVQGLAWTPKWGYWDIQKVLQAIEKDEGVNIPIILPNPYDATFGTPDQQLAGLLSNTHVYLHMSMGEAWGLPITEALALGLPTATIDYPAIREWAGDLVKYIKPEKDHYVSVEGLIHPVPRVDDAVKWIEKVYDNYDKYSKIGLRRSKYVRKHLDWKNASAKMIETISQLTS